MPQGAHAASAARHPGAGLRWLPQHLRPTAAGSDTPCHLHRTCSRDARRGSARSSRAAGGPSTVGARGSWCSAAGSACCSWSAPSGGTWRWWAVCCPARCSGSGRPEGGYGAWERCVGRGMLWCCGVNCRVPPPQERSPAVPAGPEQHNAAAKCSAPVALRSLPPPLLVAQRPGPHGPGGGIGVTHSATGGGGGGGGVLCE